MESLNPCMTASTTILSTLGFFARNVLMNFLMKTKPKGAAAMEQLKQQKIWVCWRYEMQKGRRTKVLYNTKGYKTGTRKKYKSQWVNFEKATEAVKAHAFDGI